MFVFIIFAEIGGRGGYFSLNIPICPCDRYNYDTDYRVISANFLNSNLNPPHGEESTVKILLSSFSPQ